VHVRQPGAGPSAQVLEVSETRSSMEWPDAGVVAASRAVASWRWRWSSDSGAWWWRCRGYRVNPLFVVGDLAQVRGESRSVPGSAARGPWRFEPVVAEQAPSVFRHEPHGPHDAGGTASEMK
jgi:hypothetical protein